MVSQSFEPIWRRIVECEGQAFQTVTGLPFTYSIHGRTLRTSRTQYILSRSDFEKVWKMLPIKGPGQIRDLVRGSAYVYAIVRDGRIRG